MNKGTLLNVIDNTGAIKAKCIHMYTKHKKFNIGSLILVSIVKTKTNNNFSMIKKGSLFKAVLVRSTSRPLLCRGNHFFFSDVNCVVLLKDNGDILGSRFKSPVFNEFFNFFNAPTKIFSISTNVY